MPLGVPALCPRCTARQRRWLMVERYSLRQRGHLWVVSPQLATEVGLTSAPRLPLVGKTELLGGNKWWGRGQGQRGLGWVVIVMRTASPGRSLPASGASAPGRSAGCTQQDHGPVYLSAHVPTHPPATPHCFPTLCCAPAVLLHAVVHANVQQRHGLLAAVRADWAHGAQRAHVHAPPWPVDRPAGGSAGGPRRPLQCRAVVGMVGTPYSRRNVPNACAVLPY